MEMQPTPTPIPTPAPPTSTSRLSPSFSSLRAIFRSAKLIGTWNNCTLLRAPGSRERGPQGTGHGPGSVGHLTSDEGNGGVNGQNSWGDPGDDDTHVSRDHKGDDVSRDHEAEISRDCESHVSSDAVMKPTYHVVAVGGGGGGGMSDILTMAEKHKNNEEDDDDDTDDEMVAAALSWRRYSRTRCLFTVLCSALAVMATLALAATFAVRAATTSSLSSPGATSHSHDHNANASSAIRSACNATSYPDLCYDWLISSSSSSSATLSADPLHLAATTIRLALALLQQLAPTFASVVGSNSALLPSSTSSPESSSSLIRLSNLQAFHDCVELMDLSADQLNTSVYNLEKLSLTSLRSSLAEVKSQLSGTMGFQLACKEGLLGVSGGRSSSSSSLEALESSGGNASDLAAENLREDSQLNQVSKAVAIALGLVGAVPNAGPARARVGRRLYGPDVTELAGRARRGRPMHHRHHHRKAGGGSRLLDGKGDGVRFPDWLAGPDRRWLQSWPSDDKDDDGQKISKSDVNFVVAKDGSGDYGTIQEALDNVASTNDHGSSFSSSSSSSSNVGGRFTIYIKKGVYHESLVVPKSMKGLTLVGDGIGETIITGSRSNGNGYTTYDSATVAISGANFIARKITFRNTAGPSGHQAVALRVSSDHSVFDSCSFEGYQDTLYALANRQFYTSCIISGTVDFIFGNAIAVFQRCKILGRRPMPKQKNTFTAQGRSVAADPSGFSFHLCTLEADEELSSAPFPVKSYFGRPWRAYSRTVWMQCSVSDVIDSPGWLPWDPSNPYTDTVYYGEYGNNGAGAGTYGRVTWEGVHPTMSMEEADDFTVQNFIAGSSWLPATHVNFQASLSS